MIMNVSFISYLLFFCILISENKSKNSTQRRRLDITVKKTCLLIWLLINNTIWNELCKIWEDTIKTEKVLMRVLQWSLLRILLVRFAFNKYASLLSKNGCFQPGWSGIDYTFFNHSVLCEGNLIAYINIYAGVVI